MADVTSWGTKKERRGFDPSLFEDYAMLCL